MAGVSTKAVKNRIRSMGATRQITKAMELVASSKLRRAQTQAQSARPYFEILHQTIRDIVCADRDVTSVYFREHPGKRAAFVVMAGDRGLAGGYNSNVFKLAMARMEGRDAVVLPIGKKAADFFSSQGVPVLDTACAEDMSISDCFALAKRLCRQFAAGDFGEIHVVYTNFVSALSQIPECLRLLPLTRDEDSPKDGTRSDMLYEPDSEAVFEAIVPQYVGGILYGALCQSRASEQAARRTAMDSATRNADEMIADLRLQFNRARQTAITQEITEIVAGS